MSRKYERVSRLSPRTLTDNVVLKNYELRRLFHEPREKHVSTSSSEDFHIEELFESPYEIELIETERNDFFQFTRCIFEINTRRDLRMGETHDALAELFERMNRLIRDNNRVQLVITNDFRSKNNSSSGVIRPEELSIQLMQNETQMFYHYHEAQIQDLIYTLYVYDVPAGNGGKSLKIIDNEICRCIITIPNNHCLPRAVVVGLAKKNYSMLQSLFGATQTEKTICDHRKSLQLDLALKLEIYCNIYYKAEGYSLDDVRKIEHISIIL